MGSISTFDRICAGSRSGFTAADVRNIAGDPEIARVRGTATRDHYCLGVMLAAAEMVATGAHSPAVLARSLARVALIRTDQQTYDEIIASITREDTP